MSPRNGESPSTPDFTKNQLLDDTKQPRLNLKQVLEKSLENKAISEEELLAISDRYDSEIGDLDDMTKKGTEYLMKRSADVILKNGFKIKEIFQLSGLARTLTLAGKRMETTEVEELVKELAKKGTLNKENLTDLKKFLELSCSANQVGNILGKAEDILSDKKSTELTTKTKERSAEKINELKEEKEKLEVSRTTYRKEIENLDGKQNKSSQELKRLLEITEIVEKIEKKITKQTEKILKLTEKKGEISKISETTDTSKKGEVIVAFVGNKVKVDPIRWAWKDHSQNENGGAIAYEKAIFTSEEVKELGIQYYGYKSIKDLEVSQAKYNECPTAESATALLASLEHRLKQINISPDDKTSLEVRINELRKTEYLKLAQGKDGKTNNEKAEPENKNGVLTCDNGEYNGQYKIVDGKNIQNGQGKYTWKNGDIYEGDYIDDKRTGKGKLTYKNQSQGKLSEEGEFKDDKLVNGNITYKVVSGDSLSRMAKTFGSSVAKIQEANPEINKKTSLIKINQVIKIPVGTSLLEEAPGINDEKVQESEKNAKQVKSKVEKTITESEKKIKSDIVAMTEAVNKLVTKENPVNVKEKTLGKFNSEGKLESFIKGDKNNPEYAQVYDPENQYTIVWGEIKDDKRSIVILANDGKIVYLGTADRSDKFTTEINNVQVEVSRILRFIPKTDIFTVSSK